MPHAFAWFLAAAGVTLLVDTIVGLVFGIFWNRWGRGFTALVFFASLLQAGFVVFGSIGYVVATATRGVVPTLRRALISGASFPFLLASILFALYYLALEYFPMRVDLSMLLALLVAFVVGTISPFIIRRNAA